MSEEQQTNAEKVEEVEAPKPSDIKPKTEPDSGEVEEESKDQEPDWKAESRKWESRAKANFEAVGKVEKLEADLAEKDQKLSEAQETINGYQESEKLSQARAEVADELGIPLKTLSGVHGETFDEIKANAEALLSLGKRAPVIPNIGDAPKQKRTTAEIFADHISTRL